LEWLLPVGIRACHGLTKQLCFAHSPTAEPHRLSQGSTSAILVCFLRLHSEKRGRRRRRRSRRHTQENGKCHVCLMLKPSDRLHRLLDYQKASSIFELYRWSCCSCSCHGCSATRHTQSLSNDFMSADHCHLQLPQGPGLENRSGDLQTHCSR
jgi:hypothetical protein